MSVTFSQIDRELRLARSRHGNTVKSLMMKADKTGVTIEIAEAGKVREATESGNVPEEVIAPPTNKPAKAKKTKAKAKAKG